MSSSSGNTRTTGLEQYYTPATSARTLVDFMLRHAGVSSAATWLEPAGGSGSFVDALHAAGVRDVQAFDIDPQHPDVKLADFLELDITVQNAVALTNPPFGRNHSLSVPFFNKCAQFCDTIAFIVPRSWRKWSVVNRLDKNFVKVADRDLRLSYVDAAGEPLTSSTILNTVFQVWKRSPVPRPKLPVVPPKQHFERTTPELADTALTIFGRKCGTVLTDFPRKPNTTRMFLKAEPEIVEALRAAELEVFYNQVAYVEALARPEIDYAIQESLAGRVIGADYLAVSQLETGPLNTVPPAERTGWLDLREASAT